MPTPRKSGITRAAIYARCSTSHQDTAVQVDECRALAEQRGWDVVVVHEDAAVSGTRVSRPALDRLVARRIPLASISTAHTIAFLSASAAGGLARSRSFRSALSRSFRAFGPSTFGQS